MPFRYRIRFECHPQPKDLQSHPTLPFTPKINDAGSKIKKRPPGYLANRLNLLGVPKGI